MDIEKLIDKYLKEKTMSATKQGWMQYDAYKRVGISWIELLDRLNKLGFKTKGLENLLSATMKAKDNAIKKILGKR